MGFRDPAGMVHGLAATVLEFLQIIGDGVRDRVGAGSCVMALLVPQFGAPPCPCCLLCLPVIAVSAIFVTDEVDRLGRRGFPVEFTTPGLAVLEREPRRFMLRPRRLTPKLLLLPPRAEHYGRDLLALHGVPLQPDSQAEDEALKVLGTPRRGAPEYEQRAPGRRDCGPVAGAGRGRLCQVRR